VQQEPAQELFGVYCHEPALVSVCIVLPAKHTLAVGEINQTVVGDGYAMRVARQMV
jgi:hypothetical protein